MKTIYKYPLSDGTQEIPMPNGATILTVASQRDIPCLWALVDLDQPLTYRKIKIVGTGHDFPDADEWPVYVGTFQLYGGQFIFHVFTRDSSHGQDRLQSSSTTKTV